MYNFTSFAMALNELDKEMESVIPKTDCRLRPDIRAMENGEIGNFSYEQRRFYFFLKLRNWKKKFRWTARWSSSPCIPPWCHALTLLHNLLQAVLSFWCHPPELIFLIVHPYLLLWFQLVTRAVLINNICTVVRKYPWTFQFICFHRPDAESVLLCQFWEMQSRLFKWTYNAKKYTWCRIILHGELNTFAILE